MNGIAMHRIDARAVHRRAVDEGHAEKARRHWPPTLEIRKKAGDVHLGRVLRRPKIIEIIGSYTKGFGAVSRRGKKRGNRT